MLTYRMIFTDASGQTSGSTTSLSAETDADALLLAVRMTTPDTGGEVWQGSRMVCRLPPASARLAWQSRFGAKTPSVAGRN